MPGPHWNGNVEQTFLSVILKARQGRLKLFRLKTKGFISTASPFWIAFRGRRIGRTHVFIIHNS